MFVHTCVFVCESLPGSVHLSPCLGQSPFAVCTLAGLWASGDTPMSTSSQGRSAGVADTGFHAWLLCGVCRFELGFSHLHGKNFAH